LQRGGVLFSRALGGAVRGKIFGSLRAGPKPRGDHQDSSELVRRLGNAGRGAGEGDNVSENDTNGGKMDLVGRGKKWPGGAEGRGDKNVDERRQICERGNCSNEEGQGETTGKVGMFRMVEGGVGHMGKKKWVFMVPHTPEKPRSRMSVQATGGLRQSLIGPDPEGEYKNLLEKL